MSKKTARTSAYEGVSFLDRRREQITAENEAFEEMSPEQKRVLIAQDVLDQLDAERFYAKRGNWVNALGLSNLRNKREEDLQKFFLNDLPSCHVCGLGALFTCAVERANKLPVHQFLNSGGLNGTLEGLNGSPMFTYLQGFFDQKQLDAIEVAFEQGQGFVKMKEHPNLTDEEYLGAVSFCFKVNDHRKRMEMIMENIIENNGTFVY